MWSECQKKNPKTKKKFESNGPGGLSFAVTLLAALGTILYMLYIYSQNTSIDPSVYWLVCSLFPVALTLIGGLLLYILIKGFSLEVSEPNLKETLVIWASRLYLGVFLMCILLFVLFVSLFLGIIVFQAGLWGVYIWGVIIGLAIGFIIALFTMYLKFPLLGKKHILFLVGFHTLTFPLLLLIPIVLFSPLQGHVTVGMNIICYKSDAEIPVLIQITGPDTNLSIYLLKEESDHSLYEYDSITLISGYYHSNKTVSGNQSVLLGKAIGSGKYNVFINTTNLSMGYYELVCTRHFFPSKFSAKEFKGSAKGFYLLNSTNT